MWVEGEPDNDVNVELTNPDTRLLFTKGLTATVKLALPKNGDKVNFLLFGEKRSDAVGDAKIEAHLGDKTGKVVGTQPATAFFFDPTLTLTPDGQYRIIGGLYRPAVGHVGIRLRASARARPATTDIDAGVLAGINIGIAQNTLSVNRVLLENDLVVRWGANIEAGTKAKVPSTLTRTVAVATATNDTDAFDDPLYDTATGRPNAAALTRDSPQTSAARFDVSVKDSVTGEIVGTAIYTLDSVTYDDHWRTWCVAYQTDTKAEFPQSEGTWNLAFNTGDPAADQVATTGAVAAAANPPLRGPDYTNDVLKPKITKGANVLIEQPGVESVTLTPASVKGGVAGKGTVNLTVPAGFGGTRVRLKSDKPGIAKPDLDTVVVPQGTKKVDFDIETFAVAADQNVRISASCHHKAAGARLTVTK